MEERFPLVVVIAVSMLETRPLLGLFGLCLHLLFVNKLLFGMGVVHSRAAMTVAMFKANHGFKLIFFLIIIVVEVVPVVKVVLVATIEPVLVHVEAIEPLLVIILAEGVLLVGPGIVFKLKVEAHRRLVFLARSGVVVVVVSLVEFLLFASMIHRRRV